MANNKNLSLEEKVYRVVMEGDANIEITEEEWEECRQIIVNCWEEIKRFTHEVERRGKRNSDI